ncbi:MAG: tRNA pseudouridine(38-40) synthase TruA [Bacteroidaceae bacterium]|nr:tRNA pseudouridine(38-40) synthase TruA [Bacteroidaceae bacterium]
MRYFIYLSYDGTRYHGWQIQPNGISVQEVLGKALSTLLREPIEVTGAGRTDAGVNASLMVAHFDTTQETDEQLAYRLNKFLPQDIAIHKIVPVKDDAHARFSAISRTYIYNIVTAKTPFDPYAYRFPQPLDFDLMNEAAKTLFDYTDFTSFSKLHTDVKTNNCRIMHAQWTQVNSQRSTLNPQLSTSKWQFTITADRFLRNMVRAIVGTLLDVGRGVLTIQQFREIIERKDRCSAGTSVPGNALFLADITYPEEIFKS